MLIDLVLGAAVVLEPVVEIDLLKLVAVRERPAADVHLVLGVLLHAENQGLTRVVEDAADLLEKEENNCNFLTEVSFSLTY